MEDIRDYESRMHNETNMLVRCSASEADSDATSAAEEAAPAPGTCCDDDEPAPATPSNTPTKKPPLQPSLQFSYDVDKPPDL